MQHSFKTRLLSCLGRDWTSETPMAVYAVCWHWHRQLLRFHSIQTLAHGKVALARTLDFSIAAPDVVSLDR